jgi:hypothetical protein
VSRAALRREADAWLGPLPLLAAALYLLSNLWHPAVVHDEGYAAYAAWRIHAGEMPIRDFFVNYAPGSFYVNAAFFGALGDKLAVLRSVDLLFRFCLAVFCGLAARRAGGGGAFAFITATILLGPFNCYGYAVFPALVLALAGALAWLRALEREGLRWALGAGALAGLTAFFRQDLGAYLSAALVLHAALSAGPGGRPWAWRGLAWAAAAGLLSGLLCFLPLLLAAGPAAFWRCLVEEPAALSAGVSVLPLPAPAAPLHWAREWQEQGLGSALTGVQAWIAFYGGLAALGVAGAGALRRLTEKGAQAALLYSLLGAFLLRQALNRAEMVHMMPMFLLALATLGGIGSAWARRALLAAFTLGAIVIPALAWTGYALQLRALPLAPAGPGAGLPLPEDLVGATDWVRGQTPAESRIYVANSAMERAYNNNMLFYFLAQRPCASYYAQVPPRLPPEHVASVEAALQAPSTSAVVLWDNEGRGFARQPLDLALQGFGRPAGRVGAYWIRTREELHAR